MEIKNHEIFKQIEKMLEDVKNKDEEIYGITMQLLAEVYTEYNSGKNQNIENKIYRLIDDIASKTIKKSK